MKGPLAYANARMRARRSRLLTRADAAPLFTAKDEASMQRVIAALGLEDPLRVYDLAIRLYPRGAALFRALRGLHEIEDVKLRWLRGQEESDIGTKITRIHGDDVAAAMLAFDRFASQRVLDAARNLPRRESLARQLAEAVVRERDAELVRRGAKWYGLASITGAAPDVTAMRRERLRLCRRAFVGSPFVLAPALAVILLAEEEARAVRALVERQGDESLDAPMLRALAASQLGT